VTTGALALFLPLNAMCVEPDATKTDATKPNIIFLMVDDMGYYDLGCYGSKTILTPNIDKMCAEGIKFTDVYGGCTVCGPSRSVLMTGYHKGHTPVRDNKGGIPLFPEDVTIADVLKKAGYATGGFGKWGLGNQGSKGAAELHGFDTFFGYYNQWHAHTYYTHNSCGNMKGGKRSMNEGGIRVPMVVRWPGKIKAGAVSDLPWYFPDVMPTLAELAGVSNETPKDIDGISVVPTLLAKGEQQKHGYMYWDDSWYHNEGLRMGKWKAIRSNKDFDGDTHTEENRGMWKSMKPKTQKFWLYDLSNDMGEKNNLASKNH